MRTATVDRTTKETDISVTLNLDGTGVSEISTGIGFFDHMLEGFSRHGFFDLKCQVKGDLHVDGHHTVEDTGIVLSGRPFLQFDCDFPAERVGEMDTELVREFFYAVSYSAGMNLHIRMLSGYNAHHMTEAMFKAFAKALDQAVETDSRIGGVLSTKGML